MSDRASNQQLGCDYQGHEFGARYLDSVCIEGYLWDADSGDSGGLTNGGDLPCPQCNSSAWRDYHADEIEEDAYIRVAEHRWPFRRVRNPRDNLWAFWHQFIGASEFVWDFVRGKT